MEGGIAYERSPSMLAVLFLTASLVFQFEPTWNELGSRLISADADHDTIPVSAALGAVRAVKLTVQRSDVRFTRMILHFENGDSLELRLHQLVPAGGETRTVRLKGAERAIRRVDFWYEPKTIGHRGALVELVGREGKP